MNKKGDFEMYVMFAVIVLGMLAGILWIVGAFVGIPIQTGSGQHQGYITAVEKTGLIWKTWTAYVKEDLAQSPEDTYCVIDSVVVESLREASIAKRAVTLDYATMFSRPFWECGENTAIVSVR